MGFGRGDTDLVDVVGFGVNAFKVGNLGFAKGTINFGNKNGTGSKFSNSSTIQISH